MINSLLAAVCGPNRFNVATEVVTKWESVQKRNFEKACCFFREQMGFRTNGNLNSEYTHSKTKWEALYL